MGESVLQEGGRPFAAVSEETGHRDGTGGGRVHRDGACRGNVYGCYVHGIFDDPEAAGGFLSALLKKKGYDPAQVRARDWNAYKEEQYDRLADIIRESVDMEAVYRIIEKGNDAPCIL